MYTECSFDELPEAMRNKIDAQIEFSIEHDRLKPIFKYARKDLEKNYNAYYYDDEIIWKITYDSTSKEVDFYWFGKSELKLMLGIIENGKEEDCKI